jgi:hypothetical protein
MEPTHTEERQKMIQSLRPAQWQPPRRKRRDPELTLKGVIARLKRSEAEFEALQRRVKRLEADRLPMASDDDLPELDVDLKTGRFKYDGKT